MQPHEDRNMPHVYTVGQMLDLSSAPLHSNRPNGPCKVLACLPHDNGPARYRVKCLSERYERVVEETDLSGGARTTALTMANKGFVGPAVADKGLVSVAINRR